jgi:hypothetical protein
VNIPSAVRRKTCSCVEVKRFPSTVPLSFSPTTWVHPVQAPGTSKVVKVPSGAHTNSWVAPFVSLKTPAISPAELIGPALVAIAFGALIILSVPSVALANPQPAGGGSVVPFVPAMTPCPSIPLATVELPPQLGAVKLMNVPSGCRKKPVDGLSAAG